MWILGTGCLAHILPVNPITCSSVHQPPSLAILLFFSGSGIQSRDQFLFGSIEMLIKLVPNRANPIRISSPRTMAETAVAAKVVALVTGTAREIGASLKI
eukprot:TRINITY_DN260_c0_g1_i2.p3 TRINITY_DN260_c0_g1~~TRINITY_DN260_c0_g1_i2.p3  ORF type:complete len:100 (+),score=21.69 TRINITY_DN260_c0_g1_i2:177-476(+)